MSNEQTARFKIDFAGRNDGSPYYEYTYGLYFSAFRTEGVFIKKQILVWRRLETFKTQNEAREHYEKIKDLPEYLP